MASRSKRDKLTLHAPSLGERAGSTISLPIERNEAGAALVRLDAARFRGIAEHVFPVQCGFARARHGFHELLFLQLDPFDDKRIVRMIVVRFTPERTAERVTSNEPFRLSLEQFLESVGEREVGRYSKMAQAARPASDAGTFSADVDAEADLLMFSGHRASAVFLSATSADILAATHGGAATMSFTAQIEVTLSARALADLLIMWKDLPR